MNVLLGNVFLVDRQDFNNSNGSKTRKMAEALMERTPCSNTNVKSKLFGQLKAGPKLSSEHWLVPFIAAVSGTIASDRSMNKLHNNTILVSS